jgi:hypothetical protein
LLPPLGWLLLLLLPLPSCVLAADVTTLRALAKDTSTARADRTSATSMLNTFRASLQVPVQQHTLQTSPFVGPFDGMVQADVMDVFAIMAGTVAVYMVHNQSQYACTARSCVAQHTPAHPTHQSEGVKVGS